MRRVGKNHDSNIQPKEQFDPFHTLRFEVHLCRRGPGVCNDNQSSCNTGRRSAVHCNGVLEGGGDHELVVVSKGISGVGRGIFRY